MEKGKCALCHSYGELENSHIIPRSVFRKITRKNSGKGIHLVNDELTDIAYSSDNWTEYLLCYKCEDLIENYERYALAVLRNQKGVNAIRDDNGVIFQNIEYSRFKLFLTSLIWRASVSTNQAYSKISLPVEVQEKARISILEGNSLNFSILGCEMFRLYDPTKKNGFSRKVLRKILTYPFTRIKNNRETNIFVFEGFLFEYHVPNLPFQKTGRENVLKKDKALIVPNINIFDVPELLQVMVQSYGKYIKGKSKIKS
jgi:hypothetical protein